MYAGRQYLEGYADRRARREMAKLLSNVPRTAVRHRGAALEEVALAEIHPGDRIMVRHGEVVAVDGSVAEGVAVLNRSALTGEALLIQQRAGEVIDVAVVLNALRALAGPVAPPGPQRCRLA